MDAGKPAETTASSDGFSTAQLYDLTVDYRTEPKGVSVETPVFGWKMSDTRTGQCQTAYQIRVTRAGEAPVADSPVWDSGVVRDGRSVAVAYGGETLEYGTEYAWEVCVWDTDGLPVREPARGSFETGLPADGFDRADACWIAAPTEEAPDLTAQTDFRIRAVLRMEDSGAGLVWGYSPEDRGFYWQRIAADGDDGTVRLMTDRMEQDVSLWCEETEALPVAASELEGQTFSWEIRVKGSSAQTLINDQKVWEGTLPEIRGAKGACGFHAIRGDRAYVDSFLVSAGNGEVLYADDFDDPWHTVFGEQPVVVTADGELCADGAMLLTPEESGAASPAPLFRREFELAGARQVKSARLYATALGIYTLSVNGTPVSDTLFDPGNTAYNTRTDYQIYDVTGLLRTESNAIGASLGHGWYDRAVGFEGGGEPWGRDNAFRAFLRIEYADGSEQTIATDADWRVCVDGPVRGNDLWQGEVYDARREMTGYDSFGYGEDDTWTQARVIAPEGFDAELHAQTKEPVRVLEEIEAQPAETSAAGVTVYDLGREITGVCRIRLRGPEGETVLLRHGEWMNEARMTNGDGEPGTVYTKNLLGAQSVDRYILKGDPDGEEYSPTMTFHGFRFVEIRTSSPDVRVESVSALFLSSDLKKTGTFRCSDERVNSLCDNMERTGRGNSLSIPTDCPQRSERYGWTGDAQLFCETALDFFDGGVWYADFAKSLCETQDPGTGSVADMSPKNTGADTAGKGGSGGNNVWGDAIVTIPWTLYTRYGSEQVLRDSYDGVKKWIGYLVDNSDAWVRPEDGYGDFLALDGPSVAGINTAWSAHVCDLAARMAGVLGEDGDAEVFAADAENFRRAFCDHWVTEAGWMTDGSQGSFVTAIAFDLLPEEFRESAVDHLAVTIEAQGGVQLTGFASTPYLYSVLCDHGRSALAWQLFLQDAPGSLLYPTAKGATTLWERRDAWQEASDGSYELKGSLNHPAFGSPGHWLFSGVLGIRCDEEQPGYRHILLRPSPDPALSWAEGSYESVYGRIGSRWEYAGDDPVFTVSIPANTTATMILPEGGWAVKESATGEVMTEIVTARTEDGVSLELPSGTFVIAKEQ
ncbi:MAG: glycoside hydrolase family 78 protein [Lachnospiraceae bacterium]|nr:glycoside hydrolase family 78 protein [Lachnospiraceae bacterium]